MNAKASFFLTSAAWVGVAGWLGLLWVLSAIPGNETPSIKIPHFDKIAHFVYFAAGGLLLALALGRSFGLRGTSLVMAVLFLIALIGVLDEWHQTRTPGRQGADKGDWMADCAGGIAGAVVIGWFYVLRERRRPGQTGELAPSGD